MCTNSLVVGSNVYPGSTMLQYQPTLWSHADNTPLVINLENPNSPKIVAPRKPVQEVF